MPLVSRTRIPIPGRALLTVLMTVCWLALPAALTARADDPVTLSRDGQITDRVGALGERKDQVSAALDRLYDERRIQLFVVYVRDFSGRSAQSWADATADRNGLGRDDVLLAVATHVRQYAYTVEQGSRLTDAQLRDVASTAVEPALRRHDWAGAAIGAANGYSAVLAGKAVPTPTLTPGASDPGTGNSGGTSAWDLILPVVVVGGAAVVAGYAYTRRRKRATTRTTPAATGWGPGSAGPGGPRQPTSLPELDARAKETLVETDDAVRTSEEELGFATAQFGEEAAAPFTEAVGYAKGELTAAFRLRQQLDDAIPEDDATRRRMLDEIISRCTDAGSRLDAVSEDFDRLRALERNAPQALATAETAFRTLAGRVSTAEAALTAMRGRYAESAAAPVAGAVEQAKDRLVFATSALNRARQSVDSGDNAAAAVFVRAAEGAVDQATTLVDAVDRRSGELAEAAGRLPAALTGMETDLADAGGLLEGTGAGVPTADLRGRIARAQSVLADVKGELRAARTTPSTRCAGWRRRTRRSTRRWPAPASRNRAIAGPVPSSTRRHSPRVRRSPPPPTTSPPTAGRWAARPGPASRRPSGGWTVPVHWPGAVIRRARWPRRSRRTPWPGRRAAWPNRTCGRTGAGAGRAMCGAAEEAVGSAARCSAASSSAGSWAAGVAAVAGYGGGFGGNFGGGGGPGSFGGGGTRGRRGGGGRF